MQAKNHYRGHGRNLETYSPGLYKRNLIRLQFFKCHCHGYVRNVSKDDEVDVK